MSPRRRLRFLREKAWWLNAQTTIHVVSVAIVIGIVIFGDGVKDASNESQQLLQPLPSTENGAKLIAETSPMRKAPSETVLAQRREIEHPPNHQVHVQGASIGFQGSHGYDKKMSSSKIVRPADLQPQNNRSSAYHRNTSAAESVSFKRNDIEFQQMKNGTDDAWISKPSTIQKTNIRGKARTQPLNTTEDVINAPMSITDFHKHAEERAMEDALRKRAAIESVRNRASEHGSNYNNSESPVAVNQSINIMDNKNSSYKYPNVYEGVAQTTENAILFNADNITHLSYMLYRLIKTHGIASLIDVPCTSSVLWMAGLLQRLEFEIPKFHYRCVVPNDELLVEAVLRYQDLSSAVVVKDPAFWASKLPSADLAFVWYGVGFMAPKQSWQLLKGLQQSHTRYVIVPNHPDVHRNHAAVTQHGRVNVRRAPYLFEEPLRIVNNVSTTQSRKQLLLYQLKDLRTSALL